MSRRCGVLPRGGAGGDTGRQWCQEILLEQMSGGALARMRPDLGIGVAVAIQAELARTLWTEIATAEADEALGASLRAQAAAQFSAEVFGKTAHNAEELLAL